MLAQVLDFVPIKIRKGLPLTLYDLLPLCKHIQCSTQVLVSLFILMCYSLLTAIDRKMLTLLEELKQQGRQTQALPRQILNSQGAASKDTVKSRTAS